jgi:hypothetical protein
MSSLEWFKAKHNCGFNEREFQTECVNEEANVRRCCEIILSFLKDMISSENIFLAIVQLLVKI